MANINIQEIAENRREFQTKTFATWHLPTITKIYPEGIEVSGDMLALTKEAERYNLHSELTDITIERALKR